MATITLEKSLLNEMSHIMGNDDSLIRVKTTGRDAIETREITKILRAKFDR